MDAGSRPGRSRRSSLSQINVTPLVDVMLVLLIIFMVTAPMLDKGLDVNLPQVKQAPDLHPGNEPLVVSVGRNGELRLGKEVVATPAKLTAMLREAAAGGREREVLLQADRDNPYGRVVAVMAAIRAAGIEKVGMVAQEESGQ